MSIGAMKRMFGCVLLMSGLAAAQHYPVETAQIDRCDPPDMTSSACLPAAPSAIRNPGFYSTSAITPAAEKRSLSPAERPFVPLSGREKFDRFVRNMYSPYAIFNGIYDATWGQADGSYRGYGGGMEGWGNRMGAAMAGTASHQFLGTFLLPTLFKQDPRYFAMYKGSVWKRIAHAGSRTLLTRGDNGHTQLDVSSLLAIGASETLKNTWLPAGDRSLDKTMGRVVGSLQCTATSYLFREFAPDIVRFVKGHSPRRLRRLEDKIPEQLVTGVPVGDE